MKTKSKTKVVEQDSKQEDLEGMKQENLFLKTIDELRNEGYFRLRLLNLLEKLVEVNERQADALEESLGNSEDDEEYDEEED